MLLIFFTGFLAGLVMCLATGPLFFSIIQNSIQNGYKSGIFIAIGILLSDFLIITAAVFGTVHLIPANSHLNYDAISSIGGAVLLIILGIYSYAKKGQDYTPSEVPKPRRTLWAFLLIHSFLLNLINPLNVLTWTAVATTLRSSYQYSIEHMTVFFSGSISAIFIFESSISLIAHKLKPYINYKLNNVINKTTAIVCIGFAGKLILDYIQK